MNGDGRKFEKVFFLDFEFHQPDGEKPTPLCMVAKEYHSGEIVQVWFNKGEQPLAAPLPVDKNTLVAAYLASAEMACFQALGWEMPPYVIDLYAECVFRRKRPVELTGKRPPFRCESVQRSGEFGQCRECVSGWGFYSVTASVFRSSEERFLRIDSPLSSSL